jgi:hypothetical protein
LHGARGQLRGRQVREEDRGRRERQMPRSQGACDAWFDTCALRLVDEHCRRVCCLANCSLLPFPQADQLKKNNKLKRKKKKKDNESSEKKVGKCGMDKSDGDKVHS